MTVPLSRRALPARPSSSLPKLSQSRSRALASMPLLKVSVGPNIDDLKEITYNDDSSHAVRSKLFDGLVSVHIKGETGVAKSSNNVYFDDQSRVNSTWSIRVQGRFLEEIGGDDILFGNVFDRPLSLPWGFGAALNFAQYMDPTLEHDLYNEKPWAFSPLLSTMPYLQRTRPDTDAPSKIPSAVLSMEESKPALAPALEADPTPAARRRHFADEANRKAVTLTPQVHFVCKKRGTEDTFFVVSFVVLKDGGEEDTNETNVTPVDSSDID